jgi:hypothetical protein
VNASGEISMVFKRQERSGSGSQKSYSEAEIFRQLTSYSSLNFYSFPAAAAPFLPLNLMNKTNFA